MLRYGSVYVITHTVTGKQYVGQTRQKISKRWAAHYRTALCKTVRQTKFSQFLADETPIAFTVNEMFVAFDSIGLNAAEIQLISELSPCLNTTSGGAGHRGVVPSDEVRRKRSESAKKRWANPEWKAKTVASLKKSHNTDAARLQAKNLSFMKTGTKASTHTKQLISEAGVRRNKDLVVANSAKTLMIHAKCTQGTSVNVACTEHGVSRKLFYKYLKRLHLPFFGQKPRGACFEL